MLLEPWLGPKSGTLRMMGGNVPIHSSESPEKTIPVTTELPGYLHRRCLSQRHGRSGLIKAMCLTPDSVMSLGIIETAAVPHPWPAARGGCPLSLQDSPTCSPFSVVWAVPILPLWAEIYKSTTSAKTKTMSALITE